MFAIVLQSRGGFMCVTDTSDKHVLSVWDWEKERMIAKTTVSIDHKTHFLANQANHEKKYFSWFKYGVKCFIIWFIDHTSNKWKTHIYTD